MSVNSVALAYLIASVFFILALKGLSSPLTARRGNLFGMVGMAIAVVTTLTITSNWALILACIALGGAIGAIVARRVQMTAMPELVAFMHSLVGLAAVFIAIAAVNNPVSFGLPEMLPMGSRLEVVPWHIHWRHDLVRLSDRIPEVVRPHEWCTYHLWRAAYGQSDPGNRDGWIWLVVLL